jgi:hypothetical protein
VGGTYLYEALHVHCELGGLEVHQLRHGADGVRADLISLAREEAGDEAHELVEHLLPERIILDLVARILQDLEQAAERPLDRLPRPSDHGPHG